MSKLALVTGGAGGIGAACCRVLARDGWRVVVADRDEPAAQRIAAEVGCDCIGFDVADEAATEEAALAIERKWGMVGALVAAAAMIPAPKDATDLSMWEWDATTNVGLRGAFLTAKIFGGRMVAASSGSIVLIASLAALIPMPHPAYGPAKAAVLNLAQVLAGQWGHAGVRVNALIPGPTRTPTIEASYVRGDRDPAVMERHTALRRLVYPEEVAEAAAFLLSSRASAITGTSLVVDAGTSARLGFALFE